MSKAKPVVWQVRKFQSGEETELWNLFSQTIRIVNIRDYTPEQVQVWAPDQIDKEQWKLRIEAMNPFVCLNEQELIIGYAGLLDSGYVDHFYVHHQWQRRGVGKQLMQTIDATANRWKLPELTSDVSITAKPFFEANGFTVVAPQEVQRGGVTFRNYKMRKPIV